MNQEIRTGDLFRSAALICSGGHLKESALIDREHVVFVIAGETLEEQDRRYLSGEALVNPLQLREIINQLRDIIYQQVKTGDSHYEQNTGRRNQQHQISSQSSRSHQRERDRTQAAGAAARGTLPFP